MESKNLIIAFTWTFVLVSVVVLSWQGQGMEFMGYMMFFVMALVATLAVDALIPGAQPAGTELQRELRELRARLDELNGESRLA
jgi:cobalamin biosynthesis protein CobD/CbiB